MNTINDFLPTIERWAFTGDGLQTVLTLVPGDYELTALYGIVWWSATKILTATTAATDGLPVPHSQTKGFKLLDGQQLYIYNPAGVDSYLRRVR